MLRYREKLLAALLTERTIREAAKKVGISEQCAYRYLRNPEFRSLLREARRQVMDAAVSRLTKLSDKAVDALERALTSGNASLEVRAATSILTHLRGYLGTEDQEAQLAELAAEVRRLSETREAITPEPSYF